MTRIMGKAKYIFIRTELNWKKRGRKEGTKVPYKPRPTMAAYHAAMSPEEKKKISKQLSEGLKRFWRNLTPEEKDEFVKRKAKAIYKSMYGTPLKRREMCEYSSYQMKQLKKMVGPERWAEILEARKQGIRKYQKNRSEESKKEWSRKIHSKIKETKETYIEEDVKRDNDYCGVVREAI